MDVLRRYYAKSNGWFPRVSKRAGLERGMSLIEIIIVVALIGTLMTYMIRNVLQKQKEAQVDQAGIAMQTVRQDLDYYRVHNNKYPTTEQGLQALLSDPGGVRNWRGPYTEENKLKDPWGNEFDYQSDGRTFKIISAGPEGVFGDADDITYPPSEGNASTEEQ